ncbi:hypothetical protein ACFW9F_22870 [Streptomyces sp. NPDC059506]|nr:hypothetical protein [Streptomyces sp. SCUT-3]QMV24276.1 hypothetical protein GQS52_23670 [Streptomyces sp. SCUT-3]
MVVPPRVVLRRSGRDAAGVLPVTADRWLLVLVALVLLVVLARSRTGFSR